MINALLLICIGSLLTVIYIQVHEVVQHRATHGKKIVHNRRHIGYLVPIKYNGTKSWFYVNQRGVLSEKHYSDKYEAIVDCCEEYDHARPKQSIFAKVS